MAKRYTDEFRRDAVRIATTSGLTIARQSIRSIDERGGRSFHQI
jgi:transposase-like protein